MFMSFNKNNMSKGKMKRERLHQNILSYSTNANSLKIIHYW